MSGDVTDGPTLGEVFYATWLPLAYDTCDTSPFGQRDPRDREALEAGAAAAGAAAIARLNQPAELGAAMTENVKLRKQLRALERLADEDTCVLHAGLGGGPPEELHVRVNLAKQALGQDVCGCTECMVSLGIDPEEL